MNKLIQERVGWTVRKMLAQATITLIFSFIIFFNRVFLSESVENFIKKETSHQKFDLGENYRFFIHEIIASKNC